MKIKKGTLLKVNHSRKGTFTGKALKDFDTEVDEFFPIALMEGTIQGISHTWKEGNEVPCRKGLCTIEVLKEGQA